MRTYTISEAAELTGFTRKAIARRVERGSLRSVVRHGRRRIPHSELERAGLISGEEEDSLEFDPTQLLVRRPEEGQDLPLPVNATNALAAVIRELFDRFERQAAELAGLRAITAQAESLRLTSELADMRARVAGLEAERGRPEADRAARDAGPAAGERQGRAAEQPTPEHLWLPAGTRAAQGPVRRRTPPQVEPEIANLRARLAALEGARQGAVWGRGTRFAVEAVFIAAVAVTVWLASLDPPTIFGFMALAWLIVAVVEWLSWRQER
jgi:excisionase family DNA binding protein